MLLRIERESRPRTCAPRRTATWAAFALGTTLLATACSAEPPPNTTTPVTIPRSTGIGTTDTTPRSSTATSASTTTSTSPLASATQIIPPPVASIPRAARSNTRVGAQEFARYFVEQVRRAFLFPDPRALDGLIDPGCGWCSDMIQTAENYRARGDTLVGNPFVVEASQVIEQVRGGAVVLVAGHIVNSQLRDKNGKVTREFPGKRLNMEITMRYGANWIVTRVSVAPPK